MNEQTVTWKKLPATIWFAWAWLAFCLLLLLAADILTFLARDSPAVPTSFLVLNELFSVGIAAFAIVGALVVARQPRNSIGWLFLCSSLCTAFGEFAQGYWPYALFVQPNVLPGAELMLWVNTRPYLLTGIFDLLLILCFPNGRPPSRRWWIVAGFIIPGALGLFFADAFTPGTLDPSVTAMNPLGIQAAASFLSFITNLSIYVLLIGVLGAATSLIVRFRRTRGIERQQIKLFAAALVVYAAAEGTAIYFTIGPTQTLSLVGYIALLVHALAFVLVAVAAGIAILRHRLFDIDIIIRRTLVYSILTLLLGATYLLGVVALQALFVRLTGQESALAVVASTLAIAALFGPLRRRVQAFIDRRFFRRKYDAAKVLEQFALRAQQEADLDALSGDILHVVQEALEPEAAALWLAYTRQASSTNPTNSV